MSGRIRTVKPEWLEDELLAGASDSARVLSVALLLMADDYGNGRASLASIATGAWRFEMERDDGERAPEVLARARDALSELIKIGFISTYGVAKQRYFSIRNWTKHQRVVHPGKPRVPGPEMADSLENGDLARPSRDSREEIGESRESLAPDLRSHTSDLIPPTASPARVRVREDQPATPKHLARLADSLTPTATPIAELARCFSDARHTAGFGRWRWDGRSYGPDFERLQRIDAALRDETELGRDAALAAALRGFFADEKARGVSCPLSWLANDVGGYVARGTTRVVANSTADLEAELTAAREAYQARLGEDGDRERKERLDKARAALARARSAA